jgi:hypothetical protein
MVATAIAICSAAILRQSAQNKDVVFEWLQRMQNVGELEIRAFQSGRPIWHVRPVWDEEKRHAARRGFRTGEPGSRACDGRHGIEHRQGNDRTQAAKKRAARKMK